MESSKILTQAYLNVHGQTGLTVTKQKQIQDFIRRNQIDILHCQENNIDEESFSTCNYIISNFTIIQNNAQNRYGTASLVRNEFSPENIRLDTLGRAIFFNIEDFTTGNVYLPSGTDAVSRRAREDYCSETLPQLLVNRRVTGILGGDFNCITKPIDCTHHPEAKHSPCLTRLINTFSLVDSFRSVSPSSKTYSHYYTRVGGQVGATRIDRSYHWGNIIIEDASYMSVAFSDHFAMIIRMTVPEISRLLPPLSRPLFKISPEVVFDKVFRDRLVKEMFEWQQVRERGLDVMEWWEVMIKPGIRKLAIQRSKELNKIKRSRMNCLLLKQSYFTKELQRGALEYFVELKVVKDEIKEWYENESRKVVLQSRVEDIQQSEKVRIYHHEQHIKHCKKSAILKLDTEQGMLVGHDECSDFLVKQVSKLLGQPAVLDKTAQETLLAEVSPVFLEEDIKNLRAVPDKDEVKEVLFNSNLNAAPGTDGITSLFYKEHWDLLGDPLLQVVQAVHNGDQLTRSQKTSLMVFGSKPKKSTSLKPSDKRRISLLNADFKLVTGLEAARFKNTFTHTLSPSQIVAGKDRRIHHMINKARDCIFAVSKSKLGCAILDLDFIAAFDMQVFSWVFAVLQAKGVPDDVIARIENIYQGSVTIPVVNNVRSSPIENKRGNLRQGCPGSMGWFSVAIDPLLIYLTRLLTGIPICSLPTLGPSSEDGSPPHPVTEKYKVYGYADDVKPGVTTMAEFGIVDKGAKLFELSSGCALHRDPVAGKCQVLPLGRWRRSLQQEDIPFPYMKLCETLAMVGVHLTASWQATRKLNNDELQNKVNTCIGSWKSGKFMPLVSRPFSINTYCTSKVWFRTGSVDLRVADVSAITTKLKSYCYQDLFQKPSEILLYRRVEEGGLGMFHVQSKSLAHLISTFMQTAASTRFRASLFHSWLFRFHVLGDTSLPDPGYTPYYDRKFFDLIKYVKEKTPLNPIYMSVREWYRLILEKNVTRREVDQDGRTEMIPCRVEERNPEVAWEESYRLSRLPGLSPDSKSFLFKLIHTLLPSNERLHHLNQQPSPLCGCNAGVVETYQHLFFNCELIREPGQSLLQCIRSYARDIDEEKAIRLEVNVDESFLLPAISLLSTGLQLIWDNRRLRKQTTLYTMRAELESSISIKRRSRIARIREAADIMQNMVENFLN